ncbi:MAG: roadblock/LC7 domain-containing protein [Actinomycetota bacterium]
MSTSRPATGNDRATELVEELAFAFTDVTGALLASPDGRVIAADLASYHREDRVAAIVASTLGIGQRAAELAGPTPANEILIQSGSGIVVVYAVADVAALVVLAKPGVNLALLHRRIHQQLGPLAEAVTAAANVAGP